MNLVTTKVVGTLILWLLSIFFGLIPLIVSKFCTKNDGDKNADDERLISRLLAAKRRRKMLSICMCFGGGVLLSTCFLHLLPETLEAYEKVNVSISVPESGFNITSFSSIFVPLPELMICVGFFLVYFAEEIFNSYLIYTSADLPLGHIHIHGQTNLNTQPAPVKKYQPTSNSIDYTPLHVPHHHHHHHHHHGHAHIHEMSLDSQGNQGDAVGSERSHLLTSNATSDENFSNNNPSSYGSIGGNNVTFNTCTHIVDHENENVDIHSKLLATHEQRVNNRSMFHCVLIIFALSFHSIFDGFAIGLQETNLEASQIMIAVGIHKMLIILVIGVDLYGEGLTFARIFLYVFVFSLMTPLGVTAAVISQHDIEGIISAHLTAISTGSLFYVTFFEILSKEREKSTITGFSQFLSIIVGFVFFFVFQTIGHLFT